MDFNSFQLKPELVKALEANGFKEASPIQEKAIPVLKENQSAVLKAPTGSGKTLAYLIPILNDLDDSEYTEAVIIVPTALLVKQVEGTIKQVGKDFKPIKLNILAAGAPIPDFCSGKIIIATPDQFLFRQSKMNLKYLKKLVIDEGDMILFGGFEEELKQILALDLKASKYLFTASISEHLNTMVRRYIGASKLVDVSDSNINTSTITHVLVDIRHIEKTQALELFLALVRPYKCIVFVSKGEDLLTVDKALKKDKIRHVMIDGKMEKRDQQRAYKDFNDGRVYLMIATDIAARGVDLKDVTDVISYDLPLDLTYYFHRAGRAGRFYKQGTSYVFYNNDDTAKAKELMQRGVIFKFASLREDGLKSERNITADVRHGKPNNIYVEKAIRYRIRKLHSKVVKPCYKKKVRQAIAFVKEKHKDEVIRQNIERRNQEEGTKFSFVVKHPYKGHKKRGR
jgi:ATP-dependent RNA helicase CshB